VTDYYEPLTLGSTFAGIGTIDFAFAQAGILTGWFCEIDPACRSVLKRHWPGVPRFKDIKQVRGTGQWRLTEEQKEEAVRMYDAGLSCAQIGDYFGTTRQSMHGVLRLRTTMRPKERHGADNHFWRGGQTADDRAQDVVEKAIAGGRLIRPPTCQLCGKEPPPMADGRSAIQGHHCNYNRPLDVLWLCQPCHHEWHRTNRAIPVEGGDARGTVPAIDILAGGFP
jgi:hypothetical protein